MDEVESCLTELKVVLLGDTMVGKTSVIYRYRNGSFAPTGRSTVGAAFVSRKVMTDSGEIILHIWDTAGQEIYKSLVPMYSRGANAAIIVFDVSAPETFDHVDEWISRVKEDVPEDCYIVVAGNKSDLGTPANADKITLWEQKNNSNVHFMSAKSGDGVNEVFNDVIQKLTEQFLNEPIQEKKIKPASQGDRKKCC